MCFRDNMDIDITAPTTPTFDQVGPYCVGSNPPPLTGVSIEGFTGVWGPPGINTGQVGTTMYVFVSDAGQCAGNFQMDIEITDLANASFDAVGPFCQGDFVADLPTVSNEGYSGSWTPQIDNSQTTNYTFTPDPGQCVDNQTLEIVIDQLIDLLLINNHPFVLGIILIYQIFQSRVLREVGPQRLTIHKPLHIHSHQTQVSVQMSK